jgi:two-component system chemotaxis sensor kinase CheA
MDIEALKRTFFLECEELLGASEENLEALRDGADHESAVNALFRNVHSIKGGARAFELEALAEFAHACESFLARVRKGEVELSDEVLALLFDGVDGLNELVDAVHDDGLPPSPRTAETLGRLKTQAGLDAVAPVVEEPFEFKPVPAFQAAPVAATALRRYLITVAPGPRMLASDVDPLNILRGFKALGDADIQCDDTELPDLDALDPTICHWRWTIELETAEPRAAIDEIGEMVDDLAVITVIELVSPDAEMPGGRSLAVQPPPAEPAAAPEAPPPTATAKPEKPIRPMSPPGVPKTIRVEVPKLERLGNMVGELVITQAFLMRQAEGLSFDRHPDLFRALETMSQHIRDLQDSSMALRAQPLKSVFSRFGHMLRDLEQATGKRVSLMTSGEETEIDKTVVERLNEPLTHLIRNAVDHGIEPAEERLAAGKPAEGRLSLTAEQRGSQVFIELSDDGAGINRERVRAKAVERGLIGPNATLSDDEIDQLIFLPGFSTKDAVSELSGRGVGMDAVRQTIVDMGGRVYVRSEPGRGSRFLLTLPLSLAVLDAMIAEVGHQRFLIPVHNVRRTIRPTPAQIMRFDRDTAMVSLHGEMIRIVPLAVQFNLPGAVEDPCQGLLIVVDGTAEQQRVALQVDDLLGQEPVVVKSLERNYRKVPGIAAATILGDGRAALILDLLTLGGTGRHAAADGLPGATMTAVGAA